MEEIKTKDIKVIDDLLSKYDPSMLYLIYKRHGYTTNEDYKIISTVLYGLCLKRKIEIKNDKIIIKDSSINNLSKAEKFVMNRIRDGYVNIYSNGDIQKIVHLEGSKKNIFRKRLNNPENLKYIKRNILAVIICIILNLIIAYTSIVDLDAYETLIGIIYIGYFWMLYYVITEIRVFKNVLKNICDYELTNKGILIHDIIYKIKKGIEDKSVTFKNWKNKDLFELTLGIKHKNIIESISKTIIIENEGIAKYKIKDEDIEFLENPIEEFLKDNNK